MTRYRIDEDGHAVEILHIDHRSVVYRCPPTLNSDAVEDPEPNPDLAPEEY